MKCYGCGLKLESMKELAQHLQSSQECVDKIEEQFLDNPRIKYVNPVARKAAKRKGDY